MGERLCEIGPGRFAHASGALWMPATQTIFIADVHLGYTWAMRRRRQLGPVTEGGVRDKLHAVLSELNAESVVLLGDVVHASRPSKAERQIVESTLQDLGGLARVFVVRGNHDRAFARDYAGLGIDIAERWEAADVLAVHGDRPFDMDGKHTVIGHVHPAIGVVDHAGAWQRVPAFLVSEQMTVLPAFSPFAAGVDVRSGLPSPLAGDLTVYAATGKRVVRIGPLHKILCG